jgi:hypothetical protein
VPNSNHRRALRRGLFAVAAGLVLTASLPLAAGAAPQSGFKTSQAAMIVPGPDAPPGTEIKPLITVGDTIGDYMFEAIPDGISLFKSGKNQATLLVNHETSTVPFPYVASPTTSNSFNDFRNSELSELVVRTGGGILSAEMVIDTGDGFHRFCSNFLATTDGFGNRPLLFANEEGIDWVSEAVFDDGDAEDLGWTTGTTFEGANDARQIGAVVAYDPDSGANRPIWGMGRHNHENSVAIPGYGYPVLLSGDDAFNQNVPQSQLYSYIADDADDVWEDGGDLWAFVADDPQINDYYDFQPDGTLSDGGTDPISGHFVLVPKQIATGKDLDGNDMISAEVPDALDTLHDPFPAPPADGNWQRPPGATTGPGIDGPQWILEHWGDDAGVFQFLRIEDIAYDKRPGKQNIVYLVDSGRGSAGAPQAGRSTNGRVWKMVLDPEDPKIVDELSVLIEGDNSEVKTVDEIHQPDNIESTMRGLLITEDPGSQQQFSAAQQVSDAARATTARLMYYSFETEDLYAVLKVDQSADEGPTDEDLPLNGSPASWGAWETSGIVDASAVFGPNKYLINVQAHSLYVDIDNTSAPSNLDGVNDPENDDPDWQFKREGGQLLLVNLPDL